jgi:ubiquinone/menaquinone biosynthesis C-methylase UbiE
MNRDTGSYNFSKFDETELDRLMRQGSATWSSERQFLEWAGIMPGQQVIDIGCGPGVITRLLGEYIGPIGKVTGVDISDDLLETARKLKLNTTEFHCASVYDLSAYQGQYDFAYVRLLFQHLSRPQEAMREIYSVLKPGGKVCILDSDEKIFGIYPEHPDLRVLLEETEELQKKNGGDRFVGGKLAYYMASTGFIEVNPQVFIMTPESMGRETFLDIVLKFRPMLYPPEKRERATAMMEKLYRFANDNMVHGYNGSFVVRGEKPLT